MLERESIHIPFRCPPTSGKEAAGRIRARRIQSRLQASTSTQLQHQHTDGLVLVLPGPADPHTAPEAHGDRLSHPDPPPQDRKGGGKAHGKSLFQDWDGKGQRHGRMICQRCGQLVKGTGHPAGDRASMDAHMRNSSRYLAAAGLRPAKEKCQYCGKYLASGDRWARQGTTQLALLAEMVLALNVQELLLKEALLDSTYQELLLKDSEALLVLQFMFHLAFFRPVFHKWR